MMKSIKEILASVESHQMTREFARSVEENVDTAFLHFPPLEALDHEDK